MKREIKFRAWDKGSKIIISWAYLKEKMLETYWNDLIKNYELTQYTGLKDKNGVEIYEGDIVTIDNFGDSKMEVKFVEGGYMLFTANQKTSFTDLYNIEHAGKNGSEIIGNIYQNPELIKE